MEIVPSTSSPGEALGLWSVRCLGSMTTVTLRDHANSSIASASRHRSCRPSLSSSLPAVPSLRAEDVEVVVK